MGINITPGELYYLGSIIHAEYIDYSYIKNIPNTSDILNDLEITEKLEEKNILYVDFSGQAEIDEEAVILLKPLFFGQREIRLLIEDHIVNIHSNDNKLTVVQLNTDRNDLEIEEYSNDLILSLIEGKNLLIQAADFQNGYQKYEFTDQETQDEMTKHQILSIIEGR